MNKLIITAAITGGRITREQSPYIPITPEEIAQSGIDACQAGASVVHIHARDSAGKATSDPQIYQRIVELIRKECDAIICLTTGGCVGMADELRIKTLELKPEMASFDAGSMNFGTDVFVNAPQFLEKLALIMKQRHIKPEIEVFNCGMIYSTLELVDQGKIEPPLHFQLVLGVKGGAPANAKTLLYMVDCLPPGSTWSVTGIGGRAQLSMNVLGMALGGHVRTGLEDNIYFSHQILAKSNAQLVERLVRIANEYGRPVATPPEARKLLNIHRSNIPV